MYSNASNIALSGTAGALAIMWGYGLKTHNEKLKETGSLEIEALGVRPRNTILWVQ
jgi:hypothetical protein